MHTIAVFLAPGVPYGPSLLAQLASEQTELRPVRQNLQMHTQVPLTTDEIAWQHVRTVLDTITADTKRDVVILKAIQRNHIMAATYMGIEHMKYPTDTHAQYVLPVILEALHYKLIKMHAHVHRLGLARWVFDALQLDLNNTPRQALHTLMDAVLQTPTDTHPLLTIPIPPLDIPPHSLQPLHYMTNILPREPLYLVSLDMSEQQYVRMNAIRSGVPEGDTNSLALAFEWLVQQSVLFREYITAYTEDQQQQRATISEEELQ